MASSWRHGDVMMRVEDKLDVTYEWVDEKGQVKRDRPGVCWAEMPRAPRAMTGCLLSPYIPDVMTINHFKPTANKPTREVDTSAFTSNSVLCRSFPCWFRILRYYCSVNSEMNMEMCSACEYLSYFQWHPNVGNPMYMQWLWLTVTEFDELLQWKSQRFYVATHF